jgi:hypothetical protein
VNSLRHLLLVAVLLFAQVAAGAHAIDHAVDNESSLPKHACELCLTAHNLGAALHSVAVLPPLALSHLAPEEQQTNDRGALPPPVACQRGPPAA